MSPETESGAIERWKEVGIVSWSLVGLGILVAVLFWLLAQIWAAVIPLLVGLLVFFFLRRPVDYLQERGLNRTVATLVSFIGALIILAIFFTVIIPPIASQATQFAEEFPTFYSQAYDTWRDLEAQYEAVTFPRWLTGVGAEVQDAVVSELGNLSRRMATGVVTAGSQAVGFVFNLLVGLVIGIYLVNGLPRIRAAAYSIVPERHRGEMAELISRTNLVVGGFIRGQALIAVIVGTLTALGLWIIGVPFSLIIGIITGIFNVIPYLGPIIGGFIAAVVGLFVDPWLALWAIVVVVIVQQIEGLFLSPKIMSDQVDLHPVIVMLSLLIGATILGILGMVIAIPVAGTIKAVSGYYLEKHGWKPIKPKKGQKRRIRFPWQPPEEKTAG